MNKIKLVSMFVLLLISFSVFFIVAANCLSEQEQLNNAESQKTENSMTLNISDSVEKSVYSQTASTKNKVKVPKGDSDKKDKKLISKELALSLGWISFIFFLTSSAYFGIKHIVIKICKNSDSGTSQYLAQLLKRSLNWHCILGILSFVFAVIHISNKIYEFKVSLSYTCLFSLLLLTISGIWGKYLKKIPIIKKSWRILHWINLTIFAVTFIIHVIDKTF